MGIFIWMNPQTTQFPLRDTVADLWRLVNDYNSFTIAMLNQPDDEQTVSVTNIRLQNIIGFKATLADNIDFQNYNSLIHSMKMFGN